MKKYKPTSAGRRDGSVIEYKKKLTSTQSNPLKSLTVGRKSTGGITVLVVRPTSTVVVVTSEPTVW